MEDKKNFVSIRSFVTALIIIAALMVLSYAATLLIPCEGISFGTWILSPLLVLGSDDKITLIGVILFLLIIGGTFQALLDCGVMRYMVDKITCRYSSKKYVLLAAVELFFMALGSLVGSFEEVVPMVPIITALAVSLGWDALTGVTMSLLAVGCGFAAGVFNPFTVGICQELAGLPMFSAAWFRALNFVFIYVLLFLFSRAHAKKIDRGNVAAETAVFEKDVKKDLGVLVFALIILLGIAILLSTAFLPFLRDYSFVIVSLMFLIAGVCSCLISGMAGKTFFSSFGRGALSMLPAVVMILMASSIKFTLQTAGIFEVIVDAAVKLASGLPSWAVILFIYLFVLLMNFFIASGSAKAIMLTPLLLPLAQSFGVSAQLVVVAYAFGDGFSNAFYPTNPALLISLGLADTSYKDWFRHSGKFQLMNLLLTSLLLLLGMLLGV